MSECIFCQIAAKTIPVSVVTETERTLAFRDLAPQAPTHVLVIPKSHIEHAHALAREDDEIVGEMLETARAVAELEGVEKSGYRLVFNIGDDAGNTVPHLHLHVLAGRKFTWPPG